SQTVTAPPAPPGRPEQEPPAGGDRQPAQGQARQGEGTEPAALGLQLVMGQYQAYVRAKIRKVNERIMPRSWIESTLTEQVSAVFGVTLRRGGQIASITLVRSSGHSTLDATAREAIFSASPFEGYPQAASDTIQLTVTVIYSPYR
ncbi:MAG TPA: TonB family protein, partial [Blastocatellia bacterium]|nr:TonB family protein [Blastocatellia bacterium]